MVITGSNQEKSQAKNRELVLYTLQNEGETVRARIAEHTGLNQATITNIINDFIEVGLVKETGSLIGEKGRRSIGIKLSDEKFRVGGVRLTRKYFSIGVFTLSCEETGKRVFEYIEDTAPSIVIERICDIINGIISDAGDKIYLAVGVAVPGPYYPEEGEIALITSFPGWVSIKIKETLQSRIRIPVIIEHDANAAALAESVLVQKQKGYRTVIYISAGQGIGAGILEDGKLFKGAKGVAGEIGHVCVDIHGGPCECGSRGCLQLYASTLVLTEHIRDRLGTDETFSFDDVVKLIKEKNEDALDEFHKVMDYLNAAIINLIFTYNPDLIIIGDEFSRIGEPILDSIKQNLKRLNISNLTDGLQVNLAQLGFDSAYTGAAVVATRYMFENVTEIFAVQ